MLSRATRADADLIVKQTISHGFPCLDLSRESSWKRQGHGTEAWGVGQLLAPNILPFLVETLIHSGLPLCTLLRNVSFLQPYLPDIWTTLKLAWHSIWGMGVCAEP